MAAGDALELSLDINTSKADRTITKFSQKIVKAYNAMEAENNPFATVDEDIKKTEKNIEDLSKKIEELKNQKVEILNDEAKKSIEEYTNQIEKLQSESASITPQYLFSQETASQVDALEDKLAAVNKEFKETLDDDRARELNVEIAKLEKALDEIYSKDAALEYLPEDKKRIQEINSEIDLLSEKIDSIKSDNMIMPAENVSKVAELEVALADEKNTLEALSAYQEKLNQDTKNTTEEIKNQQDGYELVTSEVKSYDAQIESVQNRLSDINNKLSAGNLTPDEEDKLVVEFEKLNNQLIDLENKEKTLNNQSSRLNAVFSSLANTIKNAFGKGLSFARKTLGGLVTILKKAGTNSIGKAFNTKGLDLKRILMYTLGIKSLYSVFSKLKSAAKEGFGYVSQYSAPLKQSVDQISAAFRTMKASVGVAVAPLVQTLAPIIVRIAGLFTMAANAVARFFAVLTGKKTVIQATNSQMAFNSALKGTCKAAKDTTKDIKQSLAAFDDLDVLTQDLSDDLDDLGGGGGSDGYDISSAFEEIEAFSEFADMIRDAWQSGDVLKAFEDIGKFIGEHLKTALDYALENFWPQAQRFATRLADALAGTINGFVQVSGLPESIGSTIAAAINTGLSFLSRFWNAVNWNAVGTFLHDGIVKTIADINWTALGNYLTGKLNGLINLAWSTIGNGDWILSAIENLSNVFYRILTEVDWLKLGETLYVAIKSLMDGAIQFIQDNREQLVTDLQLFLEGLHIDELILTLLELVGQAFVTLFQLAIAALSESDMLKALLLAAIIVIVASAITGIPVIGWALGAALMAAIGLGISENTQSVLDSLDSLANYLMTDTMGNIWVIGSDMGATLMKGTAEGIATNGTVVFDEHSRAWEVITSDGRIYTQNYEGLISGSGDQIVSTISQKTGLTRTQILNMLQDVESETGSTTQNVEGTVNDHWGKLSHKNDFELSKMAQDYLDKYGDVEKTVDTSTDNIDKTNTEFLEKLTKDVDDNLTDIKDNVDTASEDVTKKVDESTTDIKKKFDDLAKAIGQSVESFVSYMKKMSQSVADAASAIASTPIRPVVDTSSIDAGIAKLNTFLSLMAQAGSASASVPSASGSVRFNVPKMASGGVLPPNQPFLAMLGDQKKGTNIEAPLETITTAMMDALRNSNYSTGGGEVVLNIDGTELARVLLPHDLAELNRQGYNVSVLEGK